LTSTPSQPTKNPATGWVASPVEWSVSNPGKKGGWIIQHVSFYWIPFRSVGAEEVPVGNRTRIVDYYEGWEVDAEGAVYGGYINQGKNASDSFRINTQQLAEELKKIGQRPVGILEMRGYARFIPDFPMTWKTNTVSYTNGLPGSKDAPTWKENGKDVNWSDKGTIFHGFQIPIGLDRRLAAVVQTNP
jgi:hypothetical protein